MKKRIALVLFFLSSVIVLSGCRTATYIGEVNLIGNEPMPEWILRTEDGKVIQLLVDETARPLVQRYNGQLVRVRGKKGKGILFREPVTTLKLRCSKKEKTTKE